MLICLDGSSCWEAIRRLEFSDLVHEKYDIDIVLQHIGSYYIYGTNVNPLATLVANFEAALYSVLRFYSLIRWIVDAGALTCPGLVKINPEPLVHSFLNSTATAYEFFHAKNIWPYYHQHLGCKLASMPLMSVTDSESVFVRKPRIVHVSICQHSPMSNMLFVLMAMLVGFGFCPAMLGLVSEALPDLKALLRQVSSTFPAIRGLLSPSATT